MHDEIARYYAYALWREDHLDARQLFQGTDLEQIAAQARRHWVFEGEPVLLIKQRFGRVLDVVSIGEMAMREHASMFILPGLTTSGWKMLLHLYVPQHDQFVPCLLHLGFSFPLENIIPLEALS